MGPQKLHIAKFGDTIAPLSAYLLLDSYDISTVYWMDYSVLVSCFNVVDSLNRCRSYG